MAQAKSGVNQPGYRAPNNYGSAPTSPNFFTEEPKPTASNDANAIWDEMLATSGKRDSAQFVAAMEAALLAANVTNSEILTLVKAYKTFPWGDAAKINAQMASNDAKAIAKLSNGNAKGKEDYEKSKPYTSNNAMRATVIAIITRIIAAAGTNGPNLEWGSFGRTAVVASLAPKFKNEFMKLVCENKAFIHKKVLYNVLDFAEAEAILAPRWACISRVIAFLRGKNAVIHKDKGTMYNGFRVQSDHYALDRTKFPTSVVVSPPTAEQEPWDMAQVIKLPGSKTAELFGCFVAGMSAIDVRQALMSKNLRQGRTTPSVANVGDMYAAIALNMVGVIKMTPKRDLGTIKEIDLDSKAPFTQLYFDCLAFWRATVRQLVYEFFGKGTSANTRDNLKVGAMASFPATAEPQWKMNIV